jgi:hypothetical protein
VDLNLGFCVLESSGDCFLLHVEVSECLLPFLNLVEDGFNVISWIRHLCLDRDEYLEVVNDLRRAELILQVDQADKAEWLLFWSGRRTWTIGIEFEWLNRWLDG